MARTTSYGMGQYRYNQTYNYINKYEIDSSKYMDEKTTDYQNVCIKLPDITVNEQQGTVMPLVQYGRTFYMRLTIPQNNQFDTVLNLKLCPASTKEAGPNISRFQQIKQLIVPKTPTPDDDIYSNVVLFEVPEAADPERPLKVQLWDAAHNIEEREDSNISIQYNAGELYLEKNLNEKLEYRYCIETTTNIQEFLSTKSVLMDDNEAIFTLPKTWKMRDTTATTVTFDFVFSPKYNLAEGYSYLLLEIDRNEAYQRTIQYVDDDNEKTYYGTKIEKEDVKLDLWSVSNLLQYGGTAQSQIQSGTTSLTHIGVWGHPGQLLDINGEEIRIGQSGFYELDDFTINELGVIVTDRNKDRFTIDYEYKIIN